MKSTWRPVKELFLEFLPLSLGALLGGFVIVYFRIGNGDMSYVDVLKIWAIEVGALWGVIGLAHLFGSIERRKRKK